MRGARLLSVLGLVAALIAAGMLPPEHLHEATATHASIVHSHFPAQHHVTFGGAVMSAPDDDEHGVSLDNASISRVPPSPAPIFGLGPDRVPIDPLACSVGGVSLGEPAAPETPPPRHLSSRAPPAC